MILLRQDALGKSGVRRSTVDICLLIGVIAFAVCVRFIGVYVPAPTSADEGLHLTELKATLEHVRAGGSRLVVHSDIGRQFFVFKTLEVDLAGILNSPARAAFASAALAGIISIVATAWTARGLFGPTATWASLVLTSLSLIHANYSVKVLAVIHAYAAVALALLCFTSRQRALWAVGAVLLSAGFIVHYNVGVVVLALSAAILICDAWNQPSVVGWITTVAKRRLWVGALSGAALATYAFLQWRLGEFNYASHLIHHTNLQRGAVHSNFRWVASLWRLDPVLFLCALGIVLVIWRHGGLSRIVAIYRNHAPVAFITPAVIGVTAVLLVLIVTASRTLNGMTRQLLLPMAVWQVALAGSAAVAWSLLGDRLRRVALALICVLGSAALAMACSDWLTTRGVQEAAIDLKASIAQTWRPAAIDSAVYFDFVDFMDGDRGYELVERYGRRPDFLIGHARFFPFPFYEEESTTTYDIHHRLVKARLLSLIKEQDLVYTEIVYVSPPRGTEQCRAFLRSLPMGLRLHADCPRQ
jgi:hypothetical protein